MFNQIDGNQPVELYFDAFQTSSNTIHCTARLNNIRLNVEENYYCYCISLQNNHQTFMISTQNSYDGEIHQELSR